MSIAAVIRNEFPWHVENSDALSVLRSMPGGCVQACCTSPPYWNLRVYKGVEPSDWPEVTYTPMPGLPPVTVPAESSCLGLERTPEAYTAHLVLIFRELSRVLREDGCVFLNVGDTYRSKGGTTNRVNSGKQLTNPHSRSVERPYSGSVKNLVGVPYRLGFALQADGWVWRQNIGWNKTSPMPSSAQDRPTSATEEILLLTRRERYFYDIDACRVPSADVTLQRDRYSRITETAGEEQYAVRHDHETISHGGGRNLWNWWDIPADDEDAADAAPKIPWKLNAESSSERHYAQFPTTIPRRAFQLGSSSHGCCPLCFTPWRRLVEDTGGRVQKHWKPGSQEAIYAGDGHQKRLRKNSVLDTGFQRVMATVGWRKGCDCPDADPVPCLVMDIFCGSGTSGVVARALGRRFIGIEPSVEYAEMSRRHIGGVAPLLDAVQPEPPGTQPTLFGEVPS